MPLIADRVELVAARTRRSSAGSPPAGQSSAMSNSCPATASFWRILSSRA